METPPRLSPSPSTPSSGSPIIEDIGLPTPTTANDGGPSQAQIAAVLASPNQQAKRRAPTSSSSAAAGREIKTRRRDMDREDGRSRAGWENFRAESGPGGGGGRQREELVDSALVDYVRKTYGDPFDDTILKQRK